LSFFEDKLFYLRKVIYDKCWKTIYVTIKMKYTIDDYPFMCDIKNERSWEGLDYPYLKEIKREKKKTSALSECWDCRFEVYD